jgi:hypothetical protein
MIERHDHDDRMQCLEPAAALSLAASTECANKKQIKGPVGDVLIFITEERTDFIGHIHPRRDGGRYGEHLYVYIYAQHHVAALSQWNLTNRHKFGYCRPWSSKMSIESAEVGIWYIPPLRRYTATAENERQK